MCVETILNVLLCVNMYIDEDLILYIGYKLKELNVLNFRVMGMKN